MALCDENPSSSSSHILTSFSYIYSLVILDSNIIASPVFGDISIDIIWYIFFFFDDKNSLSTPKLPF